MVCDYFFKDAYYNNLPKHNLDYNKQQINKRITAGTQTEQDEQLISFINECLDNEALLYGLKFSINYLTNLIGNVIASEEDGAIYIFFDGTVAEYIGAKYAGHMESEPDFGKPYIHLSIKNYLKEFINDDLLSDIVMTQLLNEDEIKVLREMRRKNVKQIVITSKENERGIKIQTTINGVIGAEKTLQVKELLGLGNYESITLDTIDDK